MIYELRLFDDTAVPHVVKLTSWTCRGRLLDYADDYARRSGAERMELLARHFTGRESGRDYGYGRGYEPIMVGSAD